MPTIPTGSPEFSNVDDMLAFVRIEKDKFTGEHVRDLRRTDDTFNKGDISFKVRSRVFKDFELRDLKKVDKYDTYATYNLFDVSGGGAVAEAAAFAYITLKREAMKHRITGEYAQSITLFARSIGGEDIEIPYIKVKNNDLPSRPVVTMIPITPYSNKLETLQHHGVNGFVYWVSKLVKKKFGPSVSVKYDYLSGKRMATGNGSFPRLQIGGPGELKGRSDQPLKSKRLPRRKRRR